MALAKALPVESMPHVAADDDALTLLERLGLLVFFASSFVATTRWSLVPLLGDWVLGIAAAAVPGAAIGLLLTIVTQSQRPVRSAPGRTALWATLVIVHVLVLSMVGILEGYLPRDIARDAIPYAAIAIFAVMGHRLSVWRYAEAAALWTGLLSVPIALYGLDVSDVAARAAVESEAYRTQGSFGLWPLLITGLPEQKRGWRRFASGALPFFVLAEQLLFLKRAPTVRVLLVVVLLLLVAPYFAGKNKRKQALMVAGLAGVVAVALMGMFGELLSTAATSLGSRFQGQSGLGATLFEDNARIAEVVAWADSTEDMEWFVGRGMGSYFVHADVNDFVQFEVDDQGGYGRRNLHIGICEPVFRGGVLFFLVYFAGFALALGRTGRTLRAARSGQEDMRALQGALFLLVYVAFQLTEGAPTTSFYFDVAVIGLCLGRVLQVQGGRA